MATWSCAVKSKNSVKDNLAYLSNIRKAVRNATRKRNPIEALAAIDIEFLREEPHPAGRVGRRSA